MKKVWLFFIAIVMLSGCDLFDFRKPPKYSQEQIITSGKIDVQKAVESGFMPYEAAANQLVSRTNGKKYRLFIEEHYDELAAVTKSFVERELGTPIEIVEIYNFHPSGGSEVVYKVLGFPQYFNSVNAGTLLPIEESPLPLDDQEKYPRKQKIISRLFEYAFEEEITKITENLTTQFPELMPLLANSKDEKMQGFLHPYLIVGTSVDPHLENTIYQLWEDGLATRESLRELFLTADMSVIRGFVGLSAILKDIEQLPTQELFEAVTLFLTNQFKQVFPELKFNVKAKIATNLHQIYFDTSYGGYALMTIGWGWGD